jgi:uncharacterized membrane protein SirB2
MTIFAAYCFVAITVALAVFQLALALGAPLGHFAWGGQHRVLPKNLRNGNLISIGLYAVFSLIVLMRAGLVTSWPGTAWIAPAIWVLVTYLAVGIVMNAISRSRPERLVMTPTVLVLFVCALVVALGA